MLSQVVSVIESMVGQPLKTRTNRGHKEFYGPCPICKAGKDRFSVWESESYIHWDCHVCSITKNQVTLFRALGIEATQPVPYHAPVHRIPQMPDEGLYAGIRFTDETIARSAALGFEQAMEWGSSFGLDEKDIRDNQIGYNKFFHTKAGGEYCGYTIPHYHLLNGKRVLGGVRERKDGKACTDMPKYWTWPTSRIGGVYGEETLSSPDGKRIGLPLDAVFFGEDEKSKWVLCHVLRDTPHLAAVAYQFFNGEVYSWDYYLRRMCINATRLIWVQHNDDSLDNGDKGLTNALKFQSIVAPREVLIIKPPVKDVADMAQQMGVDAVRQWLQTQPACANLF